MRKSTQNTCICLITAVIMSIITVIMTYFGLLPKLFCSIEFSLKLMAAALLVLFILAALSGCHCMRKLFVALCRYGKCLVVSIVGTLITGLLLTGIGMTNVCSPLFLLILFLFVTLFAMAMLALAMTIYTITALGCPQPCKRPVHPECEEANDTFNGCKF